MDKIMPPIRALLVILAFSLIIAKASAQEHDLFSAIYDPAAENLERENSSFFNETLKKAERYRLVKVNFHALLSDSGRTAVDLFDGARVFFERKGIERPTSDGYIWRGYVLNIDEPFDQFAERLAQQISRKNVEAIFSARFRISAHSLSRDNPRQATSANGTNSRKPDFYMSRADFSTGPAPSNHRIDRSAIERSFTLSGNFRSVATRESYAIYPLSTNPDIHILVQYRKRSREEPRIVPLGE